jgi:hypothetical protein
MDEISLKRESKNIFILGRDGESKYLGPISWQLGKWSLQICIHVYEY